ncbi:DDE-type integrase/transposase/recombinase [Streptomyces sp. TRM 70361]|uniref:DDE-type integrase/transposase/recombinase n=1 Tax=Streptomyces sp. TRM 70361 TaxID=3116553 RepID=UPI003FCDD8BD
MAPGQKLVGDIVFIPTDEGWLDLATREIVGYSVADHHRAPLVTDALTTAAGHGRLQPGCIARPDRGSEHTSDGLRHELNRLGLRRARAEPARTPTTPPLSRPSRCSGQRSAPATGPAGPPPGPESSPSSRPYAAADVCGSVRTWAA